MNRKALVFRALEFAARAHRGQFRKKTKIPYLIHPLGAARLLIAQRCSDPIVAAGLLHDTVEDSSVTLAQIRKRFGKKVAELVMGASEPRHHEVPWEKRKANFLERLKSAPPEVLSVVCADKLDNMQSILEDLKTQGGSIWRRFSRPKSKQRWYYNQICRILYFRIRDNPTPILVKTLKRTVNRVFSHS